MIMKRYILTLLISFSVLSGFSQPDFKELYESIPSNDRFSNMLNLRHYQSLKPEHAISYFLLAEIHYKYMYETNPLYQFDFVQSNYHELVTYYGLAKFRLTESQSRQDREYYGNIEIITDKKKVSLPDILNAIDVRLAEADLYFNNAKSVHENYLKCISKYNECLFMFREIVEGYPNYKDLYLLADYSIKIDVETIGANFDSSLVFFDAYKVSCAKLSHLLNVNNYKLNPIVTYRLEGLVEPDFTQPVVSLWDFKSWAKNFLDILTGDIHNIKDGLVENDKQLDKQIDKLKKDEVYSDDLQYFKPEDKFRNLIGKYDYASLCNELLGYKISKVKFLAKTRETINDPNNSKEYMINRLRYFKDLAFMKVELNEEANRLKQSASIDDVGKYFEFFDTRYRGLDGLTRWCEVEKYDNDNLFISNLNHLDVFVEQETLQNAFTDSTIFVKNKAIAFGIQQPAPESLKRDTMITLHFNPFKKSWNYLSGYEIGKDSIFKSFVAKVGEKGSVAWFVIPSFQSSDSIKKIIPVFQQPLDDSTLVVVNTVLTSNKGVQKIENFISKFDWNGNPNKYKVLGANGYPRYFYVDEINEQYLMITKGQTEENILSAEDTLTVSLFDYSGNVIWKNNYLLKGNFVDVIFTNSNFFITSNYSSFSDLNSVNLTSGKDNLMNMIGIYITREGKTREIHQYKSTESLVCNLSSKVTSSHINLAGKKNQKEPFYVLIDPDGKLIFSTEPTLEHKKIDL